LAALMHGI